MVSISECDLRPLPVDIPVSHHCVPEHSWNSLCSVYLGKMVHCLKTKNKEKNRINCIAPIPAPTPPHPLQIIRLDLHQNAALHFLPYSYCCWNTNSHTDAFKTKEIIFCCSCEVGTLSEVLNYSKLSSLVDAHKSSGVAYSTRGRTQDSFRKRLVNSLGC